MRHRPWPYLRVAAAAMSVMVFAQGVEGQASAHEQQEFPVRIVIPRAMPVFSPSPSVGHRSRALVFLRVPGEPHLGLVLVNPRHLDHPTLAQALYHLQAAHRDSRSKVLVISSSMPSVGTRETSARLALDALRRLRSAQEVNIPRLGTGRMIEIALPMGGVP